MATSKSTWTKLERDIALDWTEAIGYTCLRNPLSGANNRSDKGEPRPGDVVIHPDFNADVLIEAKLRESFLHHNLFGIAEADAKRHKLKHTILCTKRKGETSYLVLLRADLFNEILRIPEVQKLLQKD